MKKVLLYFLIVFFSGTGISSFAQCDHEKLIIDCKEHLKEDHFNYIKTFTVDSKQGESTEHSFMLSHIADYEYYFTGYDWAHHTMTATLYNSDHKVVASNHPTDNKYIHVIRFTPKKDGIYYIKFEFSEGDFFCGSAVLGFHMKK